MTIVKQWRLLLLIATGQLICLVMGVFWFSSWLQRSVMDGGRIQILQANQSFAQLLAERIGEMDIENLDPGGDDWRQLQQLIETIKLPNEGYACIADNETGMLRCHPQWRTHPEVRSLEISETRLLGFHGTMLLGELFHEGGSVESTDPQFSGYATLDDGTHLIAARLLDGLSATLLVLQRERNVSAAAQQLLQPVKNIGLGVVTLITLLGLFVNSLILQNYEERLAGSNQRLERLVKMRTKSLVKTRNAIIFGLAKLAESRDTDTGEHLERIRRYVTLLAERLAKHDRSIDRDFISNLAFASSLHDIGKVGIPDAVLLKPGRLDAQERKIIEQHPAIGRKCLEAIQEQLGNDDFLEMARMIADSHHERWDGEGYPRRLKEEKIPLAARIVALADVYDALTTKRPYKDAMSHTKATEIILHGKGSHFDPRIVDAFLASQKEFEQIANDNGQSDGTSLSKPVLVAADVNALLATQPPFHTT